MFVDQEEPYDQRGLLKVDDCNFSFIAEQISFDPPTTAFYAESKANGVALEGSLELKTSVKFGFLMIKAIEARQNGSLKINLMEFNETYECDLPAYQVTNVIMAPQLDPVDRVEIVCRKTGFKAVITFANRNNASDNNDGRYGVHANVFDRKETLIFGVNGKWNGTIKIDEGYGSGKLFLTFDQIPKPPPIRCRKVAEMEWLESRRLWRHVTRSLVEEDEDRSDILRSQLKKKFLKLNLKPTFFKESKQQKSFYRLKALRNSHLRTAEAESHKKKRKSK